jgi:uncharacterized protein YndB with AHSA1/START domain
MIKGKSLSTDSMSDREIVITHEINAPRELVWKAWTDPKHVAHWWGPQGFTTTIQEMHVKKGGIWKQVMHGPDGTNYPNESVFIEVLHPKRIVYTNEGGKKGATPIKFTSVWIFSDDGDKTGVTIRMLFDSAEKRDQVANEYRAAEGGQQTLERLDEYLATLVSGAKQ